MLNQMKRQERVINDLRNEVTELRQNNLKLTDEAE